MVHQEMCPPSPRPHIAPEGTLTVSLALPGIGLIVTGASVVEISGDVDAGTAPGLRRQLLRLPPHNVALDLSGVTFLGAAGLTVLLRARYRIHLGGGTLCLVAVPPAVRRLITMTGLHDTLPCRHGATDVVRGTGAAVAETPHHNP
ncbi:MAG: STAS domain-containing protein [Umezawaea sp.]